MSVGTANGIPFTLRDLEGIATSFDALGLTGRVPLKFGHNDDQPLTDGQPALGWVSRVYVDGNSLRADFVDMPTSVFELVKAGAYKFISVELLKNVQAGTRNLPWVLDAVALLGADQPAFGNLQDLQSLTLKRKPVLQARARVAFKREKFTTNPGAPKGMEKHEVDAAIKAALDAQEVKFTAQINAVKTESAQALAAEQAKTKAAEVARHRDAIKSKFEAAVGKTIIPATREQFYKFARVEDDVAVAAIKLEDVDAYIRDNADKALMSRQTDTTGAPPADAAEKDMRPDQIVAHRAVKLCRERQKDPSQGNNYCSAVVEVLKADKALAESYQFMHDAA